MPGVPSAPTFASLSGSSRCEPGMSNSTQWVNVPPGASGSSTIKTKLWAAGWPSQRSGGALFSPSQVCLTGIASPSAKLGLLRVNATGVPPLCVCEADGPLAFDPQPARQAPISAIKAAKASSLYLALSIRQHQQHRLQLLPRQPAVRSAKLLLEPLGLVPPDRLIAARQDH